ncbi:MAG: hypothetical protein V4696_14080 [Pseudomonadota bacterium]
MRLKLCLAAILLSVPVAAAAQSMNAEAFLQRANKLKAKGPLALLSRDEIKALMTEGQAAGQAASARNKADKAAGRKPRYCAPPETKLGSDEYMARLAAIPPAERQRINMTEATNRIMAAKHPCR